MHIHSTVDQQAFVRSSQKHNIFVRVSRPKREKTRMCDKGKTRRTKTEQVEQLNNRHTFKVPSLDAYVYKKGEKNHRRIYKLEQLAEQNRINNATKTVLEKYS